MRNVYQFALFNLPPSFSKPIRKYVRIQDTVKGFKEIVEGKHDDLPEQAFYMVGGIDEVVERAKTMAEAD